MIIDKAKIFLNMYRFCRYTVKTMKTAFYLGVGIIFVEAFLFRGKNISFSIFGFSKKYFDVILNYIPPLFLNNYLLLIITIALVLLAGKLTITGLLNKSFREWAKQHNWIYDDSSKNSGRIIKEYQFIDKLFVGNNRHAFNCIRGTWDEIEAEAFNFHYQSSGNSFNRLLDRNHGCYIGYGFYIPSSSSNRTSQINNYYFGVVALNLNLKSNFALSSPDSSLLKIRSKKIVDDVSRLNLFRKNRKTQIYKNKLVIECNRVRFKESFCNDRLMQYLLKLQKNTRIDLEVFENHLIFYKNRDKINCYEVEKLLNALIKINKLGIKNTYLSCFKF